VEQECVVAASSQLVIDGGVDDDVVRSGDISNVVFSPHSAPPTRRSIRRDEHFGSTDDRLASSLTTTHLTPL
jgi:hypothetical protein